MSQVKKCFGRVEALKGVDIRIEEGMCVGLLGHNGAGKTTLLSIVTGSQMADSGEVRIGGSNKIEENRQFMGVCPQFDILWEELSPYEHVLLYTHLK